MNVELHLPAVIVAYQMYRRGQLKLGQDINRFFMFQIYSLNYQSVNLLTVVW